MEPQSATPPHTLAEHLDALREQRRTCVLRVTDGTHAGELYLSDGNIIASAFGDLRGPAAVQALLAAGDAIRYEVVSDEQPSGVVPHTVSSIESVVPEQNDHGYTVPEHTMPGYAVPQHGEQTDHDHDHDEHVLSEQELDEHVVHDHAFEETSADENGRHSAIVLPPETASDRPNPDALVHEQRPDTGEHRIALRLGDQNTDTLDETTASDVRAQHRSSGRTRVAVGVLLGLTLLIAILVARSAEERAETKTAAASAPVALETAKAPETPAAERTLGKPSTADAATANDAAKQPAAVSGTAPAAPVSPPTLEAGKAPQTPGGALAPTIAVRMLVGADGRVKQADVESRRDGFFALEQKAVEAARTYRFQPPLQSGKPVEAWITLPVRFTPTPPITQVVVKGSDTIGAALMPAWADAMHGLQPQLKVEVEALGSTTGFVALLDGSAAVAASSRLIRADELALAEKLGMQLREVFVGYDAVTVIVNPSSPLRTLDVEAVAKIFAQHIVNWSEVGGPSAAIRVLGRPGYSGTYRFFKERVLTRLGPDTGFGANVASIEKTAQIVDLVARDVNAIGYVSLAQVTPDVRALPLSTQPNGAAVAPSQQTIRDGSYPFTRPLVLYLRPDSGQDAHALVDFAISKDGQAIVEKNGFVSMPAGLPGGLAAEAAMPPTAARREVIRIYFDPSSTAIAQDSMPDLMTAAAAVRARRSVLVVGNADSSGTLQDNRQLAHQRAEVVAARLKESASRGASITVEVAAADHPLETNETSDGRRANRRVDVIVLTR